MARIRVRLSTVAKGADTEEGPAPLAAVGMRAGGCVTMAAPPTTAEPAAVTAAGRLADCAGLAGAGAIGAGTTAGFIADAGMGIGAEETTGLTTMGAGAAAGMAGATTGIGAGDAATGAAGFATAGTAMAGTGIGFGIGEGATGAGAAGFATMGIGTGMAGAGIGAGRATGCGGVDSVLSNLLAASAAAWGADRWIVSMAIGFGSGRRVGAITGCAEPAATGAGATASRIPMLSATSSAPNDRLIMHATQAPRK